MTKRIAGEVTLYMNGREIGIARDLRLGADVLVDLRPAQPRAIDARTMAERLTDAALAKMKARRRPRG